MRVDLFLSRLDLYCILGCCFMVLLDGLICGIDLLFGCLVWLTDLSLVLGVFSNWVVGFYCLCCLWLFYFGYLLGFAFAFS